MKILVVEDEKELSNSIVSYLKQEGYVCESAMDYPAGSEKADVYNYDCVIVDITLPGGSGMDIIRELKGKNSDTGIIIISAKNSLDDKISGLDIGADDYLTKPFHLSELNARVKSIIRRKKFEGNREIIFNEIKITPDEMKVFVNKKEIILTKKEYDLLVYFISNKNRVVTKESIAEHLWGDEIDTVDSFDFIYTHIKNLRKKIIEKGGEDYVKTVYGIGYKFASI
ncbi:MAG: response regulator transcription factor [Bacteroidales bacterium]|nr:response regulator transcription factor [Bacteroidales bacterium]